MNERNESFQPSGSREGPGGGERKVIAFDTFVLWVTGPDTAGPNHHTLAYATWPVNVELLGARVVRQPSLGRLEERSQHDGHLGGHCVERHWRRSQRSPR